MTAEYKDYYALLGVTTEASPEEIKHAYRRLAKQFHPDLHPEHDKTSATDKFKVINEAYEVLSDPQKKGKYDQIGSDWQESPRSGSPPGAGRPPHGPRTQRDASFGGFSDFFESVFGNAREQGFGRGERARGAPRNGPDAEAELPLSLEDSLLGGNKTFALQASVLCPACHGSGRQGNAFCRNCAGIGETRQERSITVRLPANARDGMRVRLRGQGGASASGGEPGDLYLRIRLLPHPKYKVSGSDLETSVIVMPWEASLGGEVGVSTLEGQIRIRIPAGTHSGQRLRVAGRGLGKSAASRGDLYAVVRIDIPDKTSEQMKKLYQELQAANS